MAEPSHITNRNRGHRSRSRSYRPPLIKAEARLCPACEKPTSLRDFRCRQCQSPINPFGSNIEPRSEQSVFLQVASNKRVWFAQSIDALLTSVLLFLFIWIFSGTQSHKLGRGAHAIDSGLLWVASELTSIGIAFAVVLGLHLLYQVSAPALAGYTPGRRLAGVVLVHTDGRPLSRSRLLVRACLSFGSAFFFMVGYFWPLLDRYNRSFHDWCAQTVLVERRLRA